MEVGIVVEGRAKFEGFEEKLDDNDGIEELFVDCVGGVENEGDVGIAEKELEELIGAIDDVIVCGVGDVGGVGGVGCVL
jgi:hypothetical protein